MLYVSDVSYLNRVYIDRMAFIDTPRTDAGNGTFLGRGTAIDDVSFEMSFHSPKKRQGDLLSHMRGKSSNNLRTPGIRNALLDRSNPPAQRKSGEFTPLLQSVTKRNALKGKENAFLPRTPAFLKGVYESRESPHLQQPETSAIIGSDTDSDTGTHMGPGSLLNIVSSSTMSTPLATLPTGKGDRMLEEQRNLMTLREQENVSMQRSIKIMPDHL